MMSDNSHPNNFVSVSGVSNQKQLKTIHQIHQQEGFDFPIVIGYQFSSKSINQGTKNPRQSKFRE